MSEYLPHRLVLASHEQDSRQTDSVPDPCPLYALDINGTLLTISWFAGCLTVVEETTDGTVTSHKWQTPPPGEGRLAILECRPSLFNRELLEHTARCWCGCAVDPSINDGQCLRCARTEQAAPIVTRMDAVDQARIALGARSVEIGGDSRMWACEANNGRQFALCFVEGLSIYARKDIQGNYHGIHWEIEDDFSPEAGEGGLYLPLENAAVQLNAVSTWGTRANLVPLRCPACFVFRTSAAADCTVCGHAHGEEPIREAPLADGLPVKLASLQSSEFNTVDWAWDAVDTQGRFYYITHRRGWLQITRQDDDVTMVARAQGGAYDSAVSREDILAMTPDIFDGADL